MIICDIFFVYDPTSEHENSLETPWWLSTIIIISFSLSFFFSNVYLFIYLLMLYAWCLAIIMYYIKITWTLNKFNPILFDLWNTLLFRLYSLFEALTGFSVHACRSVSIDDRSIKWNHKNKKKKKRRKKLFLYLYSTYSTHS